MSKTKQCNLIVNGLTIDHDNTLKLCGPIPQLGQQGGDCSNFKDACPSDSACLHNADGWHCGPSNLQCQTTNIGYGPGPGFSVYWNPNTRSLNYCDSSNCILPEPPGVKFCPGKTVCDYPGHWNDPKAPPLPRCMRVEGGNCSKADGTQCGEECGTFEGCQKFSSDCCFQENRAVWDAPSASWKSAWCYNSYPDSEDQKTCGRPTWRKN